MVRYASLFSQLVAFSRRNEFHNLVFRHNAERYTKVSAAGISSYPCFFANLPKPRVCVKFVSDYPAAF
jgi:hypothetical protein